MRRLMSYGSILTITFLLCSSFGLQAQVKYLLKPAESSLVIKGTSSLHDWEENVGKFYCEVEVAEKGREVESINKVMFSCKVTDIKAEHSMMEDKTQDALRSNKFPNISFSTVSVDNIVTKNGSFSGTVKGTLTLAGVAKVIDIPFSGSLLANNNLEIKGQKKIVLKDFNITPPTAMFGTLKTGPDVTLEFKLVMGAN